MANKKTKVEFTPLATSGDELVKTMLAQNGWPNTLAALSTVAKHSGMTRTSKKLMKLYSRMLKRQGLGKDCD